MIYILQHLCDLLFFFTLVPSYRLQNEQVGHLHELPGGLRVPNSDRRILPGAGAGAMDTWLSFFPPFLPPSQRPVSAEFRSWPSILVLRSWIGPTGSSNRERVREVTARDDDDDDDDGDCDENDRSERDEGRRVRDPRGSLCPRPRPRPQEDGGRSHRVPERLRQ